MLNILFTRDVCFPGPSLMHWLVMSDSVGDRQCSLAKSSGLYRSFARTRQATAA